MERTGSRWVFSSSSPTSTFLYEKEDASAPVLKEDKWQIQQQQLL